MPRTMGKNTSKAKTKIEKEVEADINEVNEEEIVENTENESKSEKKPAKKVFKNDDMIPCISITEGDLLLIGSKTGDKYHWDGIRDVQEVAYSDLIAEVRSHGSHVYAPWFIIQDRDFLDQNPKVEKLYGNLYTPNDIEKVLDLPANKMKSYIEQMPAGAQDSLKSVAMSRIASGEFDSIQRIKVLDEFFGTNLLVNLMN